MSRQTLGAVLLLCLVAALLFAPGLFAGRWFFPLHTDLLLPWSEDLEPQQHAELLDQANLALTDKAFLFHPDTEQVVASWRRGEVPAWNPTILGGVPFLGQALYGSLYPPNVLALAIRPLERAYAWIAALHVVWAGLGVFLFLRRRGLGSPASLVGGLAFAACGPLVVRYHYYMTFYPATWIPWLLWAVDRFADRPSLARLLPVPIPIAMVVLTGFPQTGVYGVYLAAGYGAWRLLRERRLPGLRPLIALGAAFLLGAVLTAAQVLPFLASSQRSMPRSRTATDQIEQSGSPWMLGGYVVPDAFYDPREPWTTTLWTNPLWSGLYCSVRPVEPATPDAPQAMPRSLLAGPNPTETSCYPGAAALLLVLVAVLGRPDRRVLLLVLALALGWLYALGFPPLVALAWYLPGWNVGEVRRILPTLGLLTAVLAALGLDRLLATDGDQHTRRALVAALLLLVAIAVVAVLLRMAGPDGLASWLEKRNVARYGLVYREYTSLLPPATEIFAFVGGRLWRAGLWLAVAALVLAGARLPWRQRRPALAAGLLGAVLLADLGTYHFSYNPFVAAKGFLRSHPLLEEIQADAGGGRLHRFEPGIGLGYDPVAGLVLPANLAAHFGLEDAMGYIVAVPTRYQRYHEALAPASVVPVIVKPLSDPASLTSPLLDGLSVRWILTRHDLERVLTQAGLDPQRFRLVARHGAARLYENTGALPSASVLPEGLFVWTRPDAGLTAEEILHRTLLERLAGDATLVRRRVYLEGVAPEAEASAGMGRGTDPELDGSVLLAVRGEPSSVASTTRAPHRVEVELTDGDGGFLLLTDGFDPGWRAEVDGMPARVLPANVAFRGVRLPPGARRVVFTYEPPEVTRGFLASGAALALLLGLATYEGIRWLVRRSRNESAGR